MNALTRRLFLSRIPAATVTGALVSSAALAVPYISAVTPEPVHEQPRSSPKARFDQHFNGLVEAMNELAGDADGWRVTIGMLGGATTLTRHAIIHVDEPLTMRNLGTGRREPMRRKDGTPMVVTVDRHRDLDHPELSTI